MSIVIMNMSSYVIEEISEAEIAYEEGNKGIGHNLPLQLGIQQHDATIEQSQKIFPPSLAAVEIDVFLQGM